MSGPWSEVTANQAFSPSGRLLSLIAGALVVIPLTVSVSVLTYLLFWLIDHAFISEGNGAEGLWLLLLVLFWLGAMGYAIVAASRAIARRFGTSAWWPASGMVLPFILFTVIGVSW